MLMGLTTGMVLLEPSPCLPGIQRRVSPPCSSPLLLGVNPKAGQRFTHIYISVWDVVVRWLSEPCSFLFSAAAGFCGGGRATAGCVKGCPGFLDPFLQTLRSFQTTTNAPSLVSPRCPGQVSGFVLCRNAACPFDVLILWHPQQSAFLLVQMLLLPHGWQKVAGGGPERWPVQLVERWGKHQVEVERGSLALRAGRG